MVLEQLRKNKRMMSFVSLSSYQMLGNRAAMICYHCFPNCQDENSNPWTLFDHINDLLNWKIPSRVLMKFHFCVSKIAHLLYHFEMCNLATIKSLCTLQNANSADSSKICRRVYICSRIYTGFLRVDRGTLLYKGKKGFCVSTPVANFCERITQA